MEESMSLSGPVASSPQAARHKSLEEDYSERFATSRQLYDRAVRVIPSGVNHDMRRIEPFPVYVDRARGSKKWDVDGNELIDYAVGHGALILGHGHPRVVEALQAQIAAMTHPSAPTSIEVEWAEQVAKMVPTAEAVRFVLSGTEATMLAMRVARAYTGRRVIARVQGHFHGWHDYSMVGWKPPFEVHASAGVPPEIDATMRPIALHDLEALEAALEAGDVAGLILEAEGPSVGAVPVQEGYLAAARALTEQYGTLLIFDEVVTGFRLAPGGAQEFFGIAPDLSTYAKAIAGGVPGGALAGRSEMMAMIAFRGDATWDRHERVTHQGTFSGYPVGAAAGVAALRELEDGSVQDYAAMLGDRLRTGMNMVLKDRGVSGCVYGLRSHFLVLIDEPRQLPAGTTVEEFMDVVPDHRLLEGMHPRIRSALQRALLLEGVDLLAGSHGWLSLAHTEEDVTRTIEAFDRSLQRLIAEGAIGSSPPGA